MAASAFLVEGPHAVAAALAAPHHRVRELFITGPAMAQHDELVAAAGASGTDLRLVTDRVLDRLSDTVTSQGVVAVVATPAFDLEAVFTPRPELVAVLDQVADPGNAGTVIRAADALGADGVVLTRGSVDVWSGKAVRSSAGSVFSLPIVTGIGTPETLDRARAAGCAVLATASDGDVDLDDLLDAGQLAGLTAWVFGNEAHGLDDDTRGRADRVVRLPLHGRAESLNLAAAAAICLYASARAHRRVLP